QAAEMVHSSQYRKHDALSCHKYKKIFETGEIFAVKKAGTFLKSKKDLHSIALYLHIADPAGNHRQHQRKHDRVHWRKLIKKHHISVRKLLGIHGGNLPDRPQNLEQKKAQGNEDRFFMPGLQFFRPHLPDKYR